MTNKEKAIEIFRLLEDNHINLYHDIAKDEFEIELNKFLEIADNLDDIHFDAEMSKLFSLFKDAHTMYWIDDKRVDKCIKFINNKFRYYDIKEQICEEIVAVNGYEISEVIQNLSKLVQYEVEQWLNDTLTFDLRGIKHLQMIDCENADNPNHIEYTVKSGKKFIKTLSNKKKEKQQFYSFEELDDHILKINYKSCADMEEYPFVKFVEDIKSKYKTLPRACVVDMRNNGGGNDVIIFPLIEWLKEKNIKTYVLMNGGVFSSGVFGLIDLKHHLNATLIGTNAGQSAHCYGECRWLKVGDKEFSYCRKYFNQTTIDTKQNVEEFPIKKVVEYLDPIKPDIYLEEKIEDVRLGIDGQLSDCLEIIKKDLEVRRNL